MPTEEELEQRVNDQIDRDTVRDAILANDIKAVRESIKRLNNMKGSTER